ncbi:zinc finger and BTB domain-containing protein 12-like isoform X1 [Tachysurus vachellii]|uniref:zinc finger and BTB domain-containing protein 12-like isoform X1 n=1 Tax=Tachysurus vachellii TaxID=175792 RepID=UPI00296AC4A5|nr:zinc finger and BTB domain-containing protein 12-like isoform X1 [Tachysurus vachellii]
MNQTVIRESKNYAGTRVMDVVCFRLPGHSDAALRNMNSLREQRHFCDITIVAGGRQMFRGHKVVLAAGSAFLRDQFLLNPSAELQQVSVLHSSTVIRELLQSCYTGILQFSAKEIVNYLTAASYLQMEHVVEKCRVALSQYLQSKSSSSGTVKTEESQGMAAIVSGSTHDMSPPSERASSLQPHSSEGEPQVSGVDHTGAHHRDEADLSVVRLRASEHSGGIEDEESRNDFSVFEVRIRDEHRGPVENAGVHEDHGDAVDLLAVRQVTHPHAEDLSRDDGGVPGSSPRGGVRIWRRRFGEPRGGRGRGFKHRKRYTYRERRPLGNFQQAWRFPTSEEIMGSFGAGIGQDYLDLGESSMRVDYQPSECQGDAAGSDGGPGHFSMDGASAEDDVGVVPLAANEENGGEDSVAVVGSTSCVTGSVACEQCGLAFSSVEDLATHSRSTHLLYVCPCCGKHFSQTSNLNRHMAVHRSAKLHSCPLCHKTFTQKSTLSDHMNMHSGQRPHVCAFCRICFAHKPALRRHLKEQHGKTTAQNYLEIQRECEEPAIGGGV